MEAIRRLADSKHQLTVVLTPAAGQIITEAQVRKAGASQIIAPGEWVNTPGLVKETDLVLIPTLSMNLAARLALGLMDSPISTLVIGALLAGKRVIAVKDGADPNGKGGLVFGAAAGAAPVLRDKLAGHLTTLASYGLELASESEFLFTVERRLLSLETVPPGLSSPHSGALRAASVGVGSAGIERNGVGPNGHMPSSFGLEALLPGIEPHSNGTKPNFITETELLWLQPGSVLRLAPGSRLTHQAQDTAKRLNLKLVFE
jgi:hypothetical protein